MRILFALLLLFAFPAQAQPNSFCAPAAGFDKVMEKYHEKQMFGYYQPTARAVKLMYANPLTGEWTLVAVGVDMQACTVANGTQLIRRAPASEIQLHDNDAELEPES